MAISTTPYTVEDLEHLDGEFELDRGRLVPVTPGGPDHSAMCPHIILNVGQFVRDHELGRLYSNDPGFILGRDPDTLRGPDIAFMRTDHVGIMRGSVFPTVAPDLAIEVVGSLSTLPEAIRKAAQYLEAGSGRVWLIDNVHRRVLDFSADGVIRTLAEGETLEGGDVLPGFSWALTDIFDILD